MGRFVRILGLSAVVALVGCTRKLEEKSRVSFNLSQFQKVEASSTQQEVSFIAINVSGPSMPRLACIYDTHDHSSVGQWRGGCVAEDPRNPLKVTAEVPSGADRLVQVLVIVEKLDTSTNTESEEFRYGEKKQSLNAGDNALEIAVNAISGATNKEGSASGRYAFSDGTGFTGTMTMEFKPPTGSPNMEVFKFEVFNGWFSIFLLDNIDLLYRFSNGHVLFGGPVRQSSAVFNGSGAVKKINIPGTVETYTEGNVSVEERRPPGVINIGFWRNGVVDTSKTVCHDPVSFTSNRRKNASTNAFLAWPGDFGPLSPSASVCDMANPPVSLNQMSVDGAILDSGGGDSPLFQGPYMKFKSAASGGHYSTLHQSVNPSTGDFTVSWRYLPGVTSNGVAGSTIFYTLNAPSDIPEHIDGSDGFDCSVLPGKGFSSVSVNGNATSAPIPNFTPVATSNPRVIVCPRKTGGGFFRSAASLHMGGCFGDGCGPSGSFGQELRFASPGGGPGSFPNITFNINQCVALDVIVVENGSLKTVSSNVTLALSLDSFVGLGGGDFYNNGSCSGGPQTSVTISGGNNRTTIGFKALSAGYVGLRAGGASGFYDAFIEGGVPGGAPDKLNFRFPHTALAINYCYPIEIHINDISSEPTPAVSGSNIAVSLTTSGVSGTYHPPNDPGCTSSALPPTNTVSIPAGSHKVRLFFKPTALNSGDLVNSGNSASLTSASNLPVSVGGDTIAYYELFPDTDATYQINACHRLSIEALNEVGAFLHKLTGSSSVDISGTLGTTFHTAHDCSPSSQTNTVQMNGAFGSIFFKTTASADISIEVTDGTHGGDIFLNEQ